MSTPFRTTFLVVLTLSLSGCCKGTLTKLLNDYGMTRVQPPRSDLGPGAIVTFKKGSAGKNNIDFICWPEQAFPGAAAPRQNQTISTKIKSELKAEIGLEANYLEKIKAEANFSRIKDIKLQLANASVVENSRADLIEAAARRTDICKQAIADAWLDGEEVYYVIQTLHADVVYKVHTETNAGAEVKLEAGVLADLSAQLGGSIKSVSDMTISGESLHWGVASKLVRPKSKSAPTGETESVSTVDMPDDLRELLAESPPFAVSDKSRADLILERQRIKPEPPPPGDKKPDPSGATP